MIKIFERIKYVLPYFNRYKNILFVDLFAAFLTTVAEIVLPLILRHLSNLAAVDIMLITKDLVLRLAILYGVIKIVEIIAAYFMTNFGHIMGAKIETDMRADIYTHLQTMSDSFYNETRVGQLMSRITNDLFDITEFSHHAPEEYFIATIKIVFSFIILVKINVPLTIIIYSMLVLMFFAVGNFRKKMHKAQGMQRKHIGNINASIEDSLSGIRVIKSFANEKMENEKFQEENEEFLSIKKVYYKAMANYMSVTRIFDGLMYLSVLVGGGYFLASGALKPGDLIAYVMYVNTMIATVRRIIEFTETFQKGLTGIERFQEIMELESDIKDKDDAYDLKDVKGEIEFKNVDFSYDEKDGKILDNFNLKIKSGESIAIVGPSGAGKSTICNLIPRFYDVDRGSITIDGSDVRDVTLESLRKQIGTVQQDVYLFNGNILENIRFGKPDATEEEVKTAAKLANAYEFIEDMPDGFYTEIGERGVRLSGGQKQRISIARVFLKNPPILILDEATSALDNKSEKIIQDSLEKLSKGRTTITIAHRLTTIQNADNILVMAEDEGIVESGNHEALMDKKGMYYDLYTKGGLIES